MVGWPMPRLTYEPGGMSAATSCGELVRLRGPRSSVLDRGAHHGHAAHGRSSCGRRQTTTRSTKMPGVTTTSGSSSPISTTRVTSAIVVAAAVAITGPKLRAVLR